MKCSEGSEMVGNGGRNAESICLERKEKEKERERRERERERNLRERDESPEHRKENVPEKERKRDNERDLERENLRARERMRKKEKNEREKENEMKPEREKRDLKTERKKTIIYMRKRKKWKDEKTCCLRTKNLFMRKKTRETMPILHENPKSICYESWSQNRERENPWDLWERWDQRKKEFIWENKERSVKKSI